MGKPLEKFDKAAADKVIARLGEIWTANAGNKTVQDAACYAARYAADAMRHVAKTAK